MKTFIISLLLSFTTLNAQENLASVEIAPLIAHKTQYIVIGISGLKTGREKIDTDDIFSRRIGKGFEDSGAWTNLNRTHRKIYKNAYLTHFSKQNELDSALKLFLNENGECREDLGLITMVNSWGAVVSQKLAQMYAEKCHRLPDLTILVEGVMKPTPLPYSKNILAYNCLNFYQRQASLKGGPIKNCQNHELRFRVEANDLFISHINAEWEGSKRGYYLIEQYLNEELAPIL